MKLPREMTVQSILNNSCSAILLKPMRFMTAITKQVFRLWRRPYIHTCRSYALPARWTNRHAHGRDHACSSPHTNCTRDFLASGELSGSKVPKMLDSLSRTPINHRAKFDAASFIPGGEIRDRTNKTHTKKQNTNKQ